MSMLAQITALEDRTGMPEDQLFLTRKHPRSAWPIEIAVSETAQMWLGIHGAFRQQSSRIQALIGAVRNGREDADAIASGFRASMETMLSHLHMHHQMEDHHYFPKFIASEPELSDGFTIIDGDHHVIHQGIFDLAGQSRAFVRATGDPKLKRAKLAQITDELGESFDQFQRNMIQHLDDEEDLVIPLLLEHKWA